MKITAIELTNVRGFKKVSRTNLSKTINVFIGANNAGKSTILNSIHLLQKDRILNQNYITIGEQSASILLLFEGNHKNVIRYSGDTRIGIRFQLENNQRSFVNRNFQNSNQIMPIVSNEPENLIYPYLSKRKAVSFQDNINEENANSVLGNFTNLYSKIDRLVTPQFQPGNAQYVNACRNILGFEVSTLAKGKGKQAVYFIHNLEHIPLTSMGEGVTNILGLITDLCVAENKIFLIEEPENDIHPKALKALLNLIIEKSDTNQFFVSTHSNIVMKYLGGAKDAKIFNIKNELSDSQRKNLFISTITEVSDDPEERKRVLEDLGYDFYDFSLWNAWLFLEESSAEVLIRDWFIKWFVPSLKEKIRTFSVGSTSQLIPKFEDFNKLFVYLHLEPTYKNKVWVVIDNGEEEEIIITKLKEMYTKSGWNESNFSQFSEHDFEKYYPPVFQERVNEILAITDKQTKRQAKKELLNEVKQWIKDDEKLAKEEFKKSAEPVILKLKEIAKQL